MHFRHRQPTAVNIVDTIYVIKGINRYRTGGTRPPNIWSGCNIASVSPLFEESSRPCLLISWHSISPKHIFYFNVDKEAPASGGLHPPDIYQGSPWTPLGDFRPQTPCYPEMSPRSTPIYVRFISQRHRFNFKVTGKTFLFQLKMTLKLEKPVSAMGLKSRPKSGTVNKPHQTENGTFSSTSSLNSITRALRNAYSLQLAVQYHRVHSWFKTYLFPSSQICRLSLPSLTAGSRLSSGPYLLSHIGFCF